MNRDMLMAGLAKFSELTMDPGTFLYRHDTPVGKDGQVHSTLLDWHEVAAAALARIESLEKAEWWSKLDEDQKARHLNHAQQKAFECEANCSALAALSSPQGETIRRLQRAIDEAIQALRA